MTAPMAFGGFENLLKLAEAGEKDTRPDAHEPPASTSNSPVADATVVEATVVQSDEPPLKMRKTDLNREMNQQTVSAFEQFLILPEGRDALSRFPKSETQRTRHVLETFDAWYLKEHGKYVYGYKERLKPGEDGRLRFDPKKPSALKNKLKSMLEVVLQRGLESKTTEQKQDQESRAEATPYPSRCRAAPDQSFVRNSDDDAKRREALDDTIRTISPKVLDMMLRARQGFGIDAGISFTFGAKQWWMVGKVAMVDTTGSAVDVFMEIVTDDHMQRNPRSHPLIIPSESWKNMPTDQLRLRLIPLINWVAGYVSGFTPLIPERVDLDRDRIRT